MQNQDKIKKAIACSFLCLMILPSRSFGWGSLTGFETHQFLLNVAYEELKLDPAFEGSGFPTYPDILSQEGVNLIRTDPSGATEGLIGGPGPDNPDSTPDSWHYYNPTLRKGAAPDAVSRFFGDYLKSTLTPTLPEVKNKCLAWSAHFLADVSVPYHVVGLPKSDLDEIAIDSSGNMQPSVPLGEVFTDDQYIMNYGALVKHPYDFKTESDRFYAAAKTRVNADWFDPWYYNGLYPATVQSSSHIQWESWIFHNYLNSSVMASGYNPEWKNPKPDFSPNPEGYGQSAREMALSSAKVTRANAKNWAKDPAPALSQAATDIKTLWRSSLTGLRAFAAAKPNFKQRADHIFDLKVYVANLTHETAKNVQIKMSPKEGCTPGASFPNEGIITLGDLGSYFDGQKVGEASGWTIKVPDIKKCKTQIDVIAEYQKTPDSQHFSVLDRPDGLTNAVYYSGSVNGDFSAIGFSGAFWLDQGTLILKGPCLYNQIQCELTMTAIVNSDLTYSGYFQVMWTDPTSGYMTAFDGTHQGFLNDQKLQATLTAPKPGATDQKIGAFVDLKVSD